MSDEEREDGVPLESMHPDEARMLRLAIDEVRDDPVPELDWERMERELLAAIDEEPAVVPRSEAPPRGTPYLWAVVAAAAAAMLFASWLWRQGPTGEAVDAASQAPTATTPVAEAPPSPAPSIEGARAVDIRALAPASVVEAGKQTVTFTLAGVVTWKLSPGGRAIVDTVSVPHEIRLERGRIDAEVNPDRPGQPREAFAIRAGDTRVAVRGTVFSVERRGDDVTVAVSRGEVAVGNSSRTGTLELLASPAEATFDLQGKPRIGEDDAESEEGTGETDGATESDEATPAEAEAKADPSAAPVPGVSRLTAGQARASVMSCLAAALHGRPDGSVTIASTVTVVLGPQGRVDAVRFAPPLEPSLQSQCSSALFGQHLEGEGTATFSVQITK